MNRKTFGKILLTFLILTALGWLLAVQMRLLTAKSREPIQWSDILIWNLAWMYLWGLLLPVVWKIGRRFPLDRKKWGRQLAIHVAAGSLFACLHVFALCAIMYFVQFYGKKPPSVIFEFMRDRFAEGDFVVGLLVYGIIGSLGQAIDLYRRYRERTLLASQLEARLSEAELDTLKMQLHPAFLFNTLRSISQLMHRDVDSADRMIARLGDFLRLTLDSEGSREVPLEQELDFLKCYLEIERVRFQNRLTTEWNTDPDTLDSMVPNLILQPIVESAFQYSKIPATGSENFSLTAKRANGSLQVKLTGRRYTKEAAEPELMNARQRLTQIYGDSHRLELRRDHTGRLEVLLEIPTGK
jgi:two-component system, LytTR family, sensor kinase